MKIFRGGAEISGRLVSTGVDGTIEIDPASNTVKLITSNNSEVFYIGFKDSGSYMTFISESNSSSPKSRLQIDSRNISFQYYESGVYKEAMRIYVPAKEDITDPYHKGVVFSINPNLLAKDIPANNRTYGRIYNSGGYLKIQDKTS